MNDYQFNAGIDAINASQTKEDIEKFKAALTQREQQLKKKEQAENSRAEDIKVALCKTQRFIESEMDKIYKGKYNSAMDAVYFFLRNSDAIKLLKQQGCTISVPQDFEENEYLSSFALRELSGCNTFQDDVGDIAIPIDNAVSN